MSLIKIKSKDLKQKTDEELLGMKDTFKIALQGQIRKIGNKSYNVGEIKKNIARINQILDERKK